MNKMEIFEDLIIGNVAPMLINKMQAELLKNYAVIIDSNAKDEEIMCVYDKETGERILPQWLNDLIARSENKRNLLLINNINKVDSLKQLRFKEILKYKSINGNKLPENTVVLVSYEENDVPINDCVRNLLINFA